MAHIQLQFRFKENADVVQNYHISQLAAGWKGVVTDQFLKIIVRIEG